MLQVTVEFLNNQYGGLKSNKTPDWPPSVTRLLQAVLAGAYDSYDPQAIELARKTVNHLEAQKPPEIYAAPSIHTSGFNHFVHNNVVKEFDHEEENRTKVCNPSRLSGQTVVYVWNVADTPSLSAFDFLHHLGRGEDFVFARAEMVDTPPTGLPRYVPTKGGLTILDVPLAGFLSDLDVVHRTRARSELTSMMPQSYALEEHIRALRQYALFGLQQLESEKFYIYPTTDAAIAAAQVRHAALKVLEREEVPDAVLRELAGHGDPKLKLQFLPLASDVAHEHATGIRRVAIVAPPATSDAIQLLKNVLPGRVLTDTTGREVCRLVVGKVDSVVQRYVGQGTEFETVTPVVWYEGATKNHKVNQSRLERVAREMFADAGLPTPIAVSVSQPREQFFAPAHLRRLPAFHLRVRFAEEVKGIVTAGLGAASGLGIFANLARS